MHSVPFDNINKFEGQLRRYNNIYRNEVLFKRLSLREKNILAENVKYKDKYRGKRCFVLGNGPSINKVDFSKLSDEIVITVNDMVCHKEFERLKSNFHFMADPAYQKLRRNEIGEAQILEKVGGFPKSNTTLLFPLSGRTAARKYGWRGKINISYFCSNLYFYDNYQEKIDFTKFIPSFQGVILWCIAFAVYMGCGTIYLLGCDMTDVVSDLSLFINQKGDLNYGFDLSKETADFERKAKINVGLEYTLYGYWKIIQGFSEMYKYCIRNNVKMYNCSEESILESIPKKKINDIL